MSRTDLEDYEIKILEWLRERNRVRTNARQRKYNQRPEVKVRRASRSKLYMREYRQRKRQERNQ